MNQEKVQIEFNQPLELLPRDVMNFLLIFGYRKGNITLMNEENKIVGLDVFKDDWEDLLKLYTTKGIRVRLAFDDVVKVVLKSNGKCVDCESDKNLQIDHFLPISKGGTNDLGNLELRCKTCNLKKGAKILGGNNGNSNI